MSRVLRWLLTLTGIVLLVAACFGPAAWSYSTSGYKAVDGPEYTLSVRWSGFILYRRLAPSQADSNKPDTRVYTWWYNHSDIGYRYPGPDGKPRRIRMLQFPVAPPVGIAAVLLAWPTAVLLLRSRRRRRWQKAGCCPKCGYSLTGNTSGTCPECGQRVLMKVNDIARLRRRWRAAKWAGLGFSLAVGAACAFSLAGLYSSRGGTWGIGKGQFIYVHGPIVRVTSSNLKQMPLMWQPGVERGAGYSAFNLPLWMPFLLVSVPTVYLFWRDRRRIPPHCCRTCGYDLTGNTSGTCPECGQSV